MKRNDEVLVRILKHLSEIDQGIIEIAKVCDALAGDDEQLRDVITHHARLLKDRELVAFDKGFVRLTWLGHTYAEGKSAFDDMKP